ncbi:MAG TPA: ATP-binding protein [Bryobacteraceae bacterium]|jgi:signal transduction histidine kinase|nr:ATP-binding protein [Bryobacteraceae bacterium]
MGERIRAFEWKQTPLGPIQGWQQSLRTAVNILLSSRYAMWMCWGDDLTMLYNDAYRPTLGLKHPSSLGARSNDVWAEIWPDIGPRIQKVITTGVATFDEGLQLFLLRSGFPEETYHTFSYSPLTRDDGRIDGMLCVVTEETERVIGDRRLRTLRDVAAGMASTNTEPEVMQVMREQLASNRKDLPFTLTYLFDEQGAARLASSSGAETGDPLAPPRIEAGGNSPWPAQHLFLHPAAMRMEDLAELRQLGPLPSGDWTMPVHEAVIVPIKAQGEDRPAGFLVVGLNPYRRYDASYGGFIDLLAGQIAAGLGNARAYDTARRRAEALAEIDRAKTTFFSNVSHELRTPLTLMLSPVEELLAQSGGRPSAERDLLALVLRNGLRLQKLVNALLDFARIEAGRMRALFRPADLCTLTSDLAANFTSAMERAGLQFQIDCQPLAGPVYVDREMWEKIVLNLLSNALKFTFEGHVRIAIATCDAFAALSVEDTGSGIPEADLPHIFERFHRVDGSRGRTIEGSGIGLALVQELVKLHGGSIQVESRVSRGTTFTVLIPFGNAHLPPDQVHEDAETGSPSDGGEAFTEEANRWLPAHAVDGDGPLPTARPERILLADDNADMRDYVARLLAPHYRVTAVGDGEQALQSVLADPPSLILSDVMMPGLDGFELLKELRARPQTATIPVVLLSARAGEESRVEGLDSGADDYLIKPFTARELLARVGAHLAMQRRRMEAERELEESRATLQRANEELRRANADLEQFAYSASHDLQEPLRQIAIYSQLLQKKFTSRLDGKGAQYLAFCIEGAHRMEMLISGLLAYSQASRTPSSPAGTVNVREVADTVRKNLAATIEETGAEIVLGDLPSVVGDSAPLVHLFQNLVSNSLKYRGEQRPRISIGASPDGEMWRFSVADNGIGIPQEFHAQVFGMFKRLHDRSEYPGTGIGLAICQKIVERYGGHIWVESEPGCGSTFLFTLPRGSHDRSQATSSTGGR